MNIQQRNRLITTAIELLTHTDHDNMIHINDKVYKFDMELFSADYKGDEIDRPCSIETCGTSCCIVGLGAVMYPHLIEIRTSWGSVSQLLYGITSAVDDDLESDVNTWDFLFSWKNPSDVIDAASRIIHILEGGRPLMDYYPEERDGVKLVSKLTSMLVP